MTSPLAEAPPSAEDLFALGNKHLATLPPNVTADTAILLILDDCDSALFLDLRQSPPAVEQCAAEDKAALADVILRTSTTTIHELLTGKLSVVRAHLRSLVKIEKGDLAKLRKMGGSFAAAFSASSLPAASASSVRVRVLDTHVEHTGGTHGLYTLLVSEGAASWVVSCRWRSLHALRAKLVSEYGPSSPCGVAIPPLPRTRHDYMGRSAAPGVRRARAASIESWCTRVFNLIPCSPQSGHGPRALLHFLRADDAHNAPPPPLVPPPMDGMPVVGGDTTEGVGGKPFASMIHKRRAAAHAQALRQLATRARRAYCLSGSSIALLAAVAYMGTVPPHLSAAFAFAAMACAVVLIAPLHSVIRRLSLVFRYVRVSMLFTRVLIVYKYTSVIRTRHASAPTRRRVWSTFHEWLGAILFSEMTSLGGLWLKVGQYLASRSDMVPDPIIAHLSQMLDRNPPRPLEETLDTLIAEWGEDAHTRLAALEPAALSCGSIAQVHIGWLHRPGEPPLKAAVKVQHKHIASVLLQDLRQSDVLSVVLAWLEPSFDFRPILREINAEHAKELDFTLEASNLTDVRANLARACAAMPVVVPAVVEELSGAKVLVMEFCEGLPIKDGAMLRANGINAEQLVVRVCEAWAAQMFTDGVFNADAHAGNILARQHPTHGAVPVLLDFGLCKRLEHTQLLALCKMVHALEEMDGDLILEALVELGFQMVKVHAGSHHHAALAISCHAPSRNMLLTPSRPVPVLTVGGMHVCHVSGGGRALRSLPRPRLLLPRLLGRRRERPRRVPAEDER